MRVALRNCWNHKHIGTDECGSGRDTPLEDWRKWKGIWTWWIIQKGMIWTSKHERGKTEVSIQCFTNWSSTIAVFQLNLGWSALQVAILWSVWKIRLLKKIQIMFILRISIECNYIPNLSKYKINVRCLTCKVYFLPRTSEINSSMCVDMYVCVCLSVCLDWPMIPCYPRVYTTSQMWFLWSWW